MAYYVLTLSVEGGPQATHVTGEIRVSVVVKRRWRYLLAVVSSSLTLTKKPLEAASSERGRKQSG